MRAVCAWTIVCSRWRLEPAAVLLAVVPGAVAVRVSSVSDVADVERR